MLDFLKSLFGDSNEREMKKLWPIVEDIKSHSQKLRLLSDEDLRAKTNAFRTSIRDAVEPIEARRDEINTLLRLGTEANVGGDGQAAEEEHELTLRERQDLYEELDQLEQDWLDAVEDTLDDLLPEAFAVVKETMRRLAENGRLQVSATDHDRAIQQRRGYPEIKGNTAIWPNTWEAGGSTMTWGMVPYDVQLLGGVVLHQGRIAEMKTGEGKTLVAVAPVYLNALVGRGVHLVTVNPYLAQRDAEWMGPIFEFHGLTVDVIDLYDSHSEPRRRAYRADISYGTNNEFGFDYLRDNSFVVEPDQLVQREHYFAIVDEVDSVLVDEARTPLIISGPVPQANDSRFAELKPTIDKLVQAQQRLAAGFVKEADQKLKERDAALEAGERKQASKLEDEAGLALLRASRGFPKNKQLVKLLQEPGVAQLMQKTEFFYLQDNAKNMPFVDDALMFALEEKQHALELTEKGREFASRSAGEDKDLFILPDLGEEVARIERDYARKQHELHDSLDARDDLTEEKREHKLENDLRLLEKEMQEAKRSIYNVYSERAERLHAIEQLLKAYTLYEKDDEYIVQEGKVMIVDQHTGRVLPGRRYSDGLHQAIEAKEEVKVQAATQTYATITLQNYFRMYDKLAGMTGTAETEAEEFHKIYGMDVVLIPTNRPIAREDLDDLVFRSKREKYGAVIQKIQEYNKKGQPVLVGTTSVDVSETLSRMLTRTGIRHNVLNAKRDRAKQEAQIVAEAGQKGAVTIATNMAGRGTDIKLDPEALRAGGLAILGTERHESRRIDLQLRGRSGRQGDPGASQFYVSLEDELMRLFGSDRVAKVMDRMGIEDGEVITHPWVNKSIERAQKKVEQNNFAIRKRQLEYDDVLNAQRQVIYDRRRHALRGERFRGEVLEMLQEVIAGIVDKHYGEGNFEEMHEEVIRTFAFDYEWTRDRFVQLGEDGVGQYLYDQAVDFYRRKREALARPFFEGMQRINDGDAETKPVRVFVDFTDGRRLLRAVVKVTDALETHGREINDTLERTTMLSIIDEKWTEHLRDLDEVKEGIGLRAYGQRDPLIEYKMEAFKLFAEMMEAINHEVVSFVFKAGPLVDGQGSQRQRSAAAPRRRLDPKRAQTEHQSSELSYGVNSGGASSAERDPTSSKQPVVIDESQRVGRNDPCPCGSGKKYKHCHGRG